MLQFFPYFEIFADLMSVAVSVPHTIGLVVVRVPDTNLLPGPDDIRENGTEIVTPGTGEGIPETEVTEDRPPHGGGVEVRSIGIGGETIGGTIGEGEDPGPGREILSEDPG